MVALANAGGSERTIVISQPMYFPWCGLINQLLLADVFVHYDDVQFARGFFNRVQIKTKHGEKLITVPLQGKRQGTRINECIINYQIDWISHHRASLVQSYKGTKHIDDAISIFDKVTQRNHELLSDLSICSIEVVSEYLSLPNNPKFLRSSQLGAEGSGSERLLKICASLDANEYLTGHGALNYLNHSLFAANDIDVKYMDYEIGIYRQVFDGFTPFVTCLDAIAHLGVGTLNILNSSTVKWDEAIERPKEIRARLN